MTPAVPRFCIVTPSYNTRRYLGACIDSVLMQRDTPGGSAGSLACPDFDYVVMDGGSSDGTVDLLRSYGDRVAWVSQKDNGQSDAINTGFARVGRGDPDEVLAWLNSDDTYAPGAFAHVAELFRRDPSIDIVYGGATYIDARDRHIAPCVHIERYDEHRLLYYSDFIVQPTTFFRRRAFEKVGRINVDLNWVMDYDLWIKFSQAGCKFAYTPRVLAHFRWLSENKTATGGMPRIIEIDKTLAGLGLPTPAYVELERCSLLAKEALLAIPSGRLGQSVSSVAGIFRTLARSPRAVASLFDPFTWSVIWVGQVLRYRASAADRRWRAEEAAAKRRRAERPKVRHRL